MNISTGMTLRLAVVGAALVTAAARPAQAASSWSFASGPAAPQVSPTAPARPPLTARAHHRQSRQAHRTRRQVHRTHRRVASDPTRWVALDQAIARIRGYRPGAAHWVVSSRYGHWGTADWYHDTLYIAPTVPTGYLYAVAVHEWSHELSVLDYDGNVAMAVAAMDKHFGGTGLTGAERAADCMAILQGATWTHYTSCTDARWRVWATRLLRGRRL